MKAHGYLHDQCLCNILDFFFIDTKHGAFAGLFSTVLAANAHRKQNCHQHVLWVIGPYPSLVFCPQKNSLADANIPVKTVSPPSLSCVFPVSLISPTQNRSSTIETHLTT
ncbi:hypothetical protein L1887_31799 [Cichorium endivia]|nr:hypothetical protein L1887_31799 [Cichorium endivia]